jgi:hypothetical protein
MQDPRFPGGRVVCCASAPPRPRATPRLGVYPLALAVLGLAVADGHAQDAAAPPSPTANAGAAPAAEPGVDLDRLLRLPSSSEFGAEKRGGATRGEWRSRFRSARADVDKSKKKLKELEGKLDEAAAESDSPWRFVPPGASSAGSENTENFTLTEAIRREKKELQRAETHLRELEVEANLASVPDDWRQ